MTEPRDGAPGTALPPALTQIVEDFQALSERDRLLLLLDFSTGLPALPARYGEHRDRMEPVTECQSPVFLAVEVGPDGDRPVHVFFDAPEQAPTTRGFAGILAMLARIKRQVRTAIAAGVQG